MHHARGSCWSATGGSILRVWGLPLVLVLGLALPLSPDFYIQVPARFTGTRTMEHGATTRMLQWVDGHIIYESETTKLSDGSTLRTTYTWSSGRDRTMISRRLVTALNQVTQQWVFGDDGSLSHVDTFLPGTAVVVRRIIARTGSPFKGHEIIYDYDGMELTTVEPYTPLLAKGFEIRSPREERVAHYAGQPTMETLEVYASSSLTPAEHQRRLRIFHNTDRIPVAVLDGGMGLDLSHPDIAYTLWNPRTFDNFGDPTITKAYGWNVHTVGQSLAERIDPYDTPVPESHGTQVSSVLVADSDHIGLVFFGGIGPHTTAADFAKIRAFINANYIRVANLSLSFPPGVMLEEAWTGLWRRLDQVIAATPHTLWVAAAGNDGWDISNIAIFPASYPHDNLLVIGALNTNVLHEKDFWRYRRAPFSNFSRTKVDLLAPGVNLLAADIGGRHRRVHGTSFAALYAIRAGILQLFDRAERTSPSIMKRMLIGTGYVSRQQPLGAQGGILFPRRAQLAVEFLRHDPSLTVEQAIVMARSRIRVRGE